jgi:hypothetical protein
MFRRISMAFEDPGDGWLKHVDIEAFNSIRMTNVHTEYGTPGVSVTVH